MQRNTLEIAVRTTGGRTIVSPDRTMTWENVEILENTLDQLIKNGSVVIELNFRSVAYLDSRVLELILDLQDQLQALSGKLTLAELNKDCRDILIATQLISDFRISTRMESEMSGTDKRGYPWG